MKNQTIQSSVRLRRLIGETTVRVVLLGVAVCLGTSHAENAAATEQPPNIVFILADDLGILDVGAYAIHLSETKADELFYETPNLDALIHKGIAFSQVYANQLCSPTRAHY